MKALLLISVSFLSLLKMNYSLAQGTTVIIFEDDKSSAQSNVKTGKKKRIFPKNDVKIGLLSAAYGAVPIYYERYIFDWFTLQTGVGITTRDFMGNIYNTIGLGAKYSQNDNNNWNEPNEYDEYDDHISYQYRKGGIGICASIAPRFFPAGDELDGWYFSPVFEYAIRNNKIQKVDATGTRIKDYMKESSKNIYFFLNSGWQKNFQPIIVDCSLSIGFSKSHYTRQDIGYTLEDNIAVYKNKTINYSVLIPYFKINLEVGAVFGQKKTKKK